jgi:hypothetical protein
VAARAELIADRGAAAEADEFFRSRSFYAAEGVTHTLRIEAAEMTAHVPVLVREVAGSELGDAISPYGYPGGEVEGGPAPDPAAIDWSAAGLVSVFARERLEGPPWLAAARERSAVLLHDPARPRRLRNRLAEQIRANARRGWTVEALPGPAAGEEERAAFELAYEQTMSRAGAAQRYFFAPEYFRTVLGFERSWLLLARSPEGLVGAGAIAAISDGLLHYFLGGTADEQVRNSPFKNVVDAMVGLAEELGARLNLGGGVTRGDGLEAFKRGFANGELPFRTHEVVCDPAEYERLSEGRARTGFFPRYRSA